TVLNLNKRDLAVLPPLSTDHCGALTKLLLSRNRLASLPSTLFEQMPNLKVLDLSDNCLGRIPEGLDRLPNLLELNVASNGIDRVGSELGVCTGLRILSLGKNRLYEVTPEALAPLLHLCFLDLSSNFMRTVPLILHKRLPTLRRLIL
ncbi:uncharacterized protein EV422DRAFT_479806, partial [Fimicolochytrium jonesii]|uniref:uncharacterized protein n=1 Tax=Fimicolochytrium jonesii TaxID=1396493 RepID=UPI0022FDB1AA